MPWYEILALVGSWIATPVIFLAYLPGSIKAIKTRQTAGIGLVAFSILTFALLCLSIFGWLVVAVSTNIAQDIAFAFFQTGSFLFSGSILIVKIINILKAKKIGVSEEVYCKNVTKTQELEAKLNKPIDPEDELNSL